MALHPQSMKPVPPLTKEIAHQAFPKGNLYMTIRDELGIFYQDSDFAELYSIEGQPALHPGNGEWKKSGEMIANNPGSVAVNCGSKANLVANNPGRKSSLLLARGFLIAGCSHLLIITIIASVLNWLGAIATLANIINPLMGWFNLPPVASLPIVLASIRKDGLLLFAEPETLAMLTPLQVLTGVYLAGVLLPCLVTLLTIAREQSLRFALLLLSRQAIAAFFFSLLLAWGGLLIK